MKLTLYEWDTKSRKGCVYALKAHTKNQNAFPKCIDEPPPYFAKATYGMPLFLNK